jgi:hypothetical protein
MARLKLVQNGLLGNASITGAYSALEHPFDASIHLDFVDYICLFDPFANAGPEAIILIDKPQRRVYHKLMRVLVQMRRDLR